MSDGLPDNFIRNSQQYAAEMRKKLDPDASEVNDVRDIHLEYHHPLEDYLGKQWVRLILKWLVKPRKGKRLTRFEEIFAGYRNSNAPVSWRVRYAPIHLVLDRMRGKTSVEEFKQRVTDRGSVVRGMVLAARSVVEFGLQTPQRFIYPLFSVWNFTNRCNLKCKHCYQSAGKGLDGELTLDEKLAIVDQLGENYMPMIAFAGGEPTISDDLVPVLARCRDYQIHTSLATNGALLTPKLADQLTEAGLRYVEVSLDSVNPEKHDRFRGIPGAWAKTVEGMKTVVAAPGLRLGVAMCVHHDNSDEVRDMIEFAIDIGASCFAYFNFIPVGRGTGMVEQDITPDQRERLLELLNEYIQSGRIGVISTCPQFGRVCLAHSPIYSGRVAASHAGSGSGTKARVIAKYLGGCGAGRTYVSIQPNGNITPCVYMPDRVMGNLRDASLKEIIDKSDLWDLLNRRDQRWGHCGVCAFRYYCGGCRARSDAYFSDPAGPDPGCIFNINEWNKLAAAVAVSAAEER
jgi:radical SAM protein with 4Fe4S-binding SPASM domain